MDNVYTAKSERESVLLNPPAELSQYDKEKGASSFNFFSDDDPGDFSNLYRKKRSLDFFEPSLPRFPNAGPFIRRDIPDPSRNNVPIKNIGKNLDDAFLGYSMSNGVKVCCVLRDKIIFREDYESITKKVRIISSGVGLWGDFVGTGMLTCMILGTHGSPKPRVIYTALKELNKTADQGILAIVPNNYDDKLNWGMAIARAQRKGIEMDCFNFGDNANEDQEVAWRTCLPGIVISFKLAGAMSEEKRSLTFIAKRLKVMFFSSISYHFGPTTVRIGTDLEGTGGRMMEGASRSDVMREVVSCLMGSERKFSVGLDPGAELVLFVNTYVAQWYLSQVVAMEMLQWISKKGFKCARVYSGNLVPSVIQGFSVTILPEACSNIVRWLDNYTTCLGWLVAGTGDICKYQIDTRQFSQEYKGIYFNTEQTVFMRRVVDLAASRFIASEDYLNSIDRRNMFGTNMSKVIDSLIKDSDSDKSLMQCPHYLFTKLAIRFEDIFNNNEGIMFALLCTTMGQYFAEHSRPSKRLNERVWQRALQKSVMSLAGYFKIGHKDCTLLDIFGSLYIIIASSGLDTVTCLYLALEVGEELCWKAKYVKSKGIIDCPQAMMKASCIILDAIATGLRERLAISAQDIDTTPNIHTKKIKEALLFVDK